MAGQSRPSGGVAEAGSLRHAPALKAAEPPRRAAFPGEPAGRSLPPCYVPTYLLTYLLTYLPAYLLTYRSEEVELLTNLLTNPLTNLLTTYRSEEAEICREMAELLPRRIDMEANKAAKAKELD